MRLRTLLLSWKSILAAVVCALIAAISLRSLSHPQPYRFLDGQTPVLADDKSTSERRVIDRSYAFRGNFSAVVQRATIELASHGFVVVRDDNSMGPRAIQFERRSGPDSGRTAFIILYQDMHYKLPQFGEPYGLVGYDDPGWVSAQVYVEHKPRLIKVMSAKVSGWLSKYFPSLRVHL